MFLLLYHVQRLVLRVRSIYWCNDFYSRILSSENPHDLHSYSPPHKEDDYPIYVCIRFSLSDKVISSDVLLLLPCIRIHSELNKSSTLSER